MGGMDSLALIRKGLGALQRAFVTEVILSAENGPMVEKSFEAPD